MHDCHCSGNHSLRRSIGAIRCECGGKLSDAQIISRLISRVEDLEEHSAGQVQALEALGCHRCDICRDWFPKAELITGGNRATCDRCFRWGHFCREDDDEADIEEVLPWLMKHYTRISSRLPHDLDGTLSEPFKSAYDQCVR